MTSDGAQNYLSDPQGDQRDLYDPPPPAEMLAARRAALAIIHAIFLKKQNLDQAFDESREFLQLPLRDKAFVKMMVTTLIRRLGQIDDLIKRALSRPDQPLNPPILETVLRMGAVQLMFMNVPDHAAVNTSVQLIEAEGHSRMKGFINAILRRIAADGKDWLTRQDAARLNTPEWLLKQWISDYGLKTTLDIASANVIEPPLDITVKRPEHIVQWAETLEAQILPTGSLRLVNAKLVQELAGFQDGLWWVQDTAASLPARLMGNIEGQTVLDLCAAPGGKTAQLASQGANVLSLDRSAKRVLRLQENMRRLQLDDKVKTEIADAAVWRPREKVNYILLDAPCSATGTIRRNPDVPWMKHAQDVHSLMDLQTRLLLNASDMLNHGGIMMYCTCSLQKDEGEYQIDRLLNARPDMVRVPIRADEIGGLAEGITPQGDVRLFPHFLGKQGGLDGFFIARLQRV